MITLQACLRKIKDFLYYIGFFFWSNSVLYRIRQEMNVLAPYPCGDS